MSSYRGGPNSKRGVLSRAVLREYFPGYGPAVSAGIGVTGIQRQGRGGPRSWLAGRTARRYAIGGFYKAAVNPARPTAWEAIVDAHAANGLQTKASYQSGSSLIGAKMAKQSPNSDQRTCWISATGAPCGHRRGSNPSPLFAKRFFRFLGGGGTPPPGAGQCPLWRAVARAPQDPERCHETHRGQVRTLAKAAKIRRNFRARGQRDNPSGQDSSRLRRVVSVVEPANT